jgi:hypothetical protein
MIRSRPHPERYWIMPRTRPLVPPDASTLHYWHYECPDRDCVAPVVRGGIGFAPDQVEVLKARPAPTLRCTACGTTMTGYLQVQKHD